jgi:hypothetical protein
MTKRSARMWLGAGLSALIAVAILACSGPAPTSSPADAPDPEDLAAACVYFNGLAETAATLLDAAGVDDAGDSDAAAELASQTNAEVMRIIESPPKDVGNRPLANLVFLWLGVGLDAQALAAAIDPRIEPLGVGSPRLTVDEARTRLEETLASSTSALGLVLPDGCPDS